MARQRQTFREAMAEAQAKIDAREAEQQARVAAKQAAKTDAALDTLMTAYDNEAAANTTPQALYRARIERQKADRAYVESIGQSRGLRAALVGAVDVPEVAGVSVVGNHIVRGDQQWTLGGVMASIVREDEKVLVTVTVGPTLRDIVKARGFKNLPDRSWTLEATGDDTRQVYGLVAVINHTFKRASDMARSGGGA